MKQEEKGVLIANTEAVQAIRDFLSDWYDVPSIYKTIALAYGEVNFITSKKGIELGEMENITKVLDQCMMMVELLEPFKDERK